MGPRQRQARKRAKTHTVPLVLVSLVGFILIMGISFAAGMFANVSRWLSDLPDYTDTNQYLVSQPTTILDANGNEIASLYVQNRETTTIDQVSQNVINATIAIEDERFYEHSGVDFIGIARAVVSQLTGGSEGGSTITQQLVRNTILSEEQFDQTIERKVREAWLALKMEEIYNKDEILMMYLNTIYYGHGAYGIETAAQTYFSKSASDLTLAEAALLAGLPNGPSIYDPTENLELAIERRNLVLERMLSNGYITQEDYDAAVAEAVTLNVQEVSINGTLAYPYFVDYVRGLLQEEFSTDMIFKGGLTVKTTLDPTMQAAAERICAERISYYDSDGSDELDVGLVAIDPDNGFIKAMVGGTNYNRNESHINHATSPRPVGSSFKAFTLAAAIHEGMSPSVLINANTGLTINGTKFQNFGNASYGTITLTRATAVSSNTAYVQVAQAIGNDKVIEMCAKLGLDTEGSINGQANFMNVTSLTLGVSSISALNMAEAYATFANGGYHRESVAISEILSRTGATIYAYEDTGEQVLTTGEAQVVTDVLKTVFTSGTAAGYTPSIDQPVAGKTGTATNESNSVTNIWLCGYTPQLSVAVWSGHTNDNRSIGDLHPYQIPVPIFRDFMEEALAGVAREEFPTGEAPTYKANSSWGFVVSSSATGTDADDNEEEPTDTPTTEPATTPNTNSGNNTGGGENGNSGDSGDGGDSGNSGGNSGDGDSGNNGSSGGGNSGDNTNDT